MILNNPEPSDSHVKSDLLRWILICCGWCCIAVGVVGIFVPLLPTVPFLLLAAACFTRSSKRFHSWLLEHSHLGPLVRDYLISGGIPLRAKRVAIGMVWVSFPVSVFLFAQAVWLKIVLLSIASVITLYLMQLPTAPPVETDRRINENGD